MQPDRDYRHECRVGCDCPDTYDPIFAAHVRGIAGRVLKLLHASCPGTFEVVWDKRIGTSGYMRKTFDNYFVNIGPDRWLRVMRINVDNVPGQLTVFSVWLDEASSEGLNYHLGSDDEVEALERFLNQRLILEDLSKV